MKVLNYKNINNLLKSYIIPAFKSKERKNMFMQIYEIIWLVIKTKYWPHNYFKYNVYKKGRKVSDIVPYIPGRLYDSIAEDVFNDKRMNILVENKFLFNKFLKMHKISCTDVYGRYIKNIGFINSDDDITEEKNFLRSINGDFVMKPVQGSAQGKGVKIISLVSKGRYIVDDNELSENELEAYIHNLAENVYDNGEILFEKKLIQHENIQKIYGNSINTVRVCTLRLLNGEIYICAALLRVGKNGRKVDNWSGEKGGIAIGIDIKTGTLNKYGYDYYSNEYNKHPDTNIYFEGIRLPYWEKIKEIVKNAAKVFPNLASIGWDVSITEAGPVIIEGNNDYGVLSAQVTCGPYLKDQILKNEIKKYVIERGYWKKYKKYLV